ncbi:MAG: esterase/lipase family protein [Gemmatimonadota bacterium]
MIPRRRALALVAVVLALAAGHTAAAPAGAAARPPASRVLPEWRTAVPDTAPGTVVLLHGLGRTHRSMAPMERALREAGYRVVNLGYPSREHTVQALADTVAAELRRCCGAGSEPIHFVTHSMGGLLVRAYQAAYGPDRIGRVVMLSPPNRGSEIIDRLPEGLVRVLLGPAAIQLGTDSTSVPRQLPRPEFELGIITGDASLNPLFSWWLPGEDDGRVSVRSARLEAADDFLVVPHTHTFIMRHDQVIQETLAFLAAGRFTDES